MLDAARTRISTVHPRTALLVIGIAALALLQFSGCAQSRFGFLQSTSIDQTCGHMHPCHNRDCTLCRGKRLAVDPCYFGYRPTCWGQLPDPCECVMPGLYDDLLPVPLPEAIPLPEGTPSPEPVAPVSFTTVPPNLSSPPFQGHTAGAVPGGWDGRYATVWTETDPPQPTAGQQPTAFDPFGQPWQAVPMASER